MTPRSRLISYTINRLSALALFIEEGPHIEFLLNLASQQDRN